MQQNATRQCYLQVLGASSEGFLSDSIQIKYFLTSFMTFPRCESTGPDWSLLGVDGGQEDEAAQRSLCWAGFVFIFGREL